MPGRKTDVKDAEWLAELLMHGLLKASFVPPAPQRALRDLTRYRSKLVGERARLVNRLQKMLEDANIKLASVASDVLGVSGRAMLEALLQGENEGPELAKLARGRLRKKSDELQKALTGRMKEHHRFLLGQQLSHYDFLTGQIEQVSERVKAQLAQMDAPPPSDSSAKGQPAPGAEPGEVKSAAPPVEPLTQQAAMEFVLGIDGISERTAEVILAEIGSDMSRFPSADHLAAWGGLAPGNHQSAGKRQNVATRKGNHALRVALCQAAWAASRTKGTYLQALYQRLAHRRGKKRAIVAVARSILVTIYHLLTKRAPYQDLGSDHFDQRKREQTAKHLVRRLHNLGYEVSATPVPAVTAQGGL